MTTSVSSSDTMYNDRELLFLFRVSVVNAAQRMQKLHTRHYTHQRYWRTICGYIMIQAELREPSLEQVPPASIRESRARDYYIIHASLMPRNEARIILSERLHAALRLGVE